MANRQSKRRHQMRRSGLRSWHAAALAPVGGAGGGADAALARDTHDKATNKKKPSAGMTGITAGGANIKIVGYGCGNDTVPLAVTETKRLMEQAKADVMIGPLSGDEAVSVANYANSHPKKTFII